MKTADEKILVLPDRFRDPFLFEGIISMGGEFQRTGITFDLSRVGFMEPYSMVSFLLLGRNYLRESGEKIKLVNIPVKLHQYLARMDFFEKDIFEVPEILNEKLFLKRTAESRRLIEIKEIPNKEKKSIKVIASVIALFRKRASLILKYWMSESVVDYFVTVISELCQNIFEHSLDSGYLAIQTYNTGRENIARLVISDSGIGIRKSFENKENMSFETTSELMEMALTMPISSKRPYGYGLCQVSTIVERLKGGIYMRSGDASLTVLYNKKERGASYIFHKNGLEYFSGTQISITLSSK